MGFLESHGGSESQVPAGGVSGKMEFAWGSIVFRSLLSGCSESVQNVIDDFRKAYFGGEAIVDETSGAARIVEGFGDETVVFFVERSPVATVNENYDWGLRARSGEEIDRLQVVITVGDVERMGKGGDGVGAELLVSVEIFLEVRVASSQVELSIDGVDGGFGHGLFAAKRRKRRKRIFTEENRTFLDADLR